jgi:hypothetical protein
MTMSRSTSHGGNFRGLAADAAPHDAFGRYGRMFRLPPAKPLGADALKAIAEAMIKHDKGKPITEAETIDENPTIPSGYTYFGQFVDHDITFDPTPLNAAAVDPHALVDFRSPALDLDSVYGRGPDDQPYMYDGLELRVGPAPGAAGAAIGTRADLHRLEDGTAILGDKRNDENKIVSQLHGAMIRLHNKVVRCDGLIESFLRRPPQNDSERFRTAAAIVRWHYQWVVVFDYLPRICEPGIVAEVFNNGKPVLPHYLNSNAPFGYMPVEFAAAAYRFGHSMVRPSYSLNRDILAAGGADPAVSRIPTFVPGPTAAITDSLGGIPGKGIGRLPQGWGIDFSFFLDGLDGPQPTAAINGFQLPQLSYRIDALLSEPLQALPEFADEARKAANAPTPIANLAFRNLMRGQMLELPSGEAVSLALRIAPLGPDVLWGAGSSRLKAVPPAANDLCELRKVVESRQKVWTTYASQGLAGNTPLWYYILREAEYYGWTKAPCEPGAGFGGQHLGPVGSRIVAETLIGLLWMDQGSFLHGARRFTPMPEIARDGELTLAALVRFALTDN